MIIDHVGMLLFPEQPIYRLVGRASAPLFFFLVGYSGKLHISRWLILYGCLLSFSASFIYQHIQFNILFNFIFISFMLSFLPPQNMSSIFRVLFFIIALVSFPITDKWIEYGTLGLLFAYAGRLLAIQDKQAGLWLALTLISYFIFETALFRFYHFPWMVPCFVALVVSLMHFMLNYHLYKVYCPVWLLPPARFVSRASLHIYFFHLVVLQAYFVKTHAKAYFPSAY